jgi:hypothetical protein
MNPEWPSDVPEHSGLVDDRSWVIKFLYPKNKYPAFQIFVLGEAGDVLSTRSFYNLASMRFPSGRIMEGIKQLMTSSGSL